jgi:hypothetical protein
MAATESGVVSALTDDHLGLALDGLEAALVWETNGRTQAWTERVADALDGVKQAVQRHTEASESADGPLAKADLTRPTLVRRVGNLRQDHKNLRELVKGLQTEVQRIALTDQSDTAPATPNQPLPPPRQVGEVPGLGTLRQRVQELADALRRHREAEADISLESVNMDLGAGD